MRSYSASERPPILCTDIWTQLDGKTLAGLVFAPDPVNAFLSFMKLYSFDKHLSTI